MIAIFPAIPTLLAALIADANNCVLHEGFKNPCVVLGLEMGDILYSMGAFAWLLFFSVPVGVLGLLVGVIWFAFAFSRNES